MPGTELVREVAGKTLPPERSHQVALELAAETVAALLA